MEKFQEYIIPFLDNGFIRYLADGVAKSMSVEYFQKNFTRIASTELPNIGHSSYYYQNKENPDLVMRFRISQNVGVSATIISLGEFKNQVAVLDNL